MATPTYKELVVPSTSTPDGLEGETVEERILTCMSILASGQNPDGTPNSGGTGAVASVFGRTGAVVATTGDYSATQVTGALSTLPPLAGLWYGTSVSGTILGVNETVYAVPIFLAFSHTWQSILVNVTTIGATGAVVRLGIYADNGAGYPGALVLDAGTVVTTGLGVAAIAITELLPAGTYYLTAVPQGAPVTQATFTGGGLAAGPAQLLAYATATTATLSAVYLKNTAAAGALPTPFPAGAGLGGAGGFPMIRLQA